MSVNGSAAMLFDLENDPYERINVAAANLDVVQKLADLISEYAKDAPTEWVVWHFDNVTLWQCYCGPTFSLSNFH